MLKQLASLLRAESDIRCPTFGRVDRDLDSTVVVDHHVQH
jgi:hypothetical protein